MMESINVVVNDDHAVFKSTNDEDEIFPSNTDVRTDAENIVDDISSGSPNVRTDAGDKEDDIILDEESFPVPEQRGPSRRIQKNHPAHEVIGEIGEGMRTCPKAPVNYREMIGNLCFVSKIESKNVNEAIDDEYWISAMQEELVQFERNEV